MNNIRKFREEKGISQASLAEMLNVNQVTVSRWETSERDPSIRNLIKISKIFDVGLDDLLIVGFDHSSIDEELKELK